MPRKEVIRRFSQLSGGAGEQTVLMDAYPGPTDLLWYRLVGRVVSGDATLLELGLRMGVSDYPLVAKKVSNAGETVEVGCQVPGQGEYRIYGKFTGTAAGETLELVAFGIEG